MATNPTTRREALPESSPLDRIVLASGRTVSHAELSAAFDLVADPADWRGPIDATVATPADYGETIAAAVQFFTATRPCVRMVDERARIHVSAPGYRNGPAGP